MSTREPLRAAPAPRRCGHCGRAVRPTQHTRGDYTVDYYALHGGRGEVAEVAGDHGTRATYVRLLEPDELLTCVECYPRPAVQAERERRFRPERDEDGA